MPKVWTTVWSHSLSQHLQGRYGVRNDVRKWKLYYEVESDAETSTRHQKEDIFGKYEDKDYDDSDTDYIDEDDEDQHYSRNKSKYDPWQVFVAGA